MSATDHYRPSKRTENVLVRAEWLPVATVVPVPVRNYVNRERSDKRIEVTARVLHNKATAAQDMREQLRDALWSAAYEGPVGTRVRKDEPVDCESVSESVVVIEHYSFNTDTMENIRQQLRAEIRAEQARAKARTEEASRLRDEQMIEKSAREHGFGGRVGVTL